MMGGGASAVVVGREGDKAEVVDEDEDGMG